MKKKTRRQKRLPLKARFTRLLAFLHAKTPGQYLYLLNIFRVLAAIGVYAWAFVHLLQDSPTPYVNAFLEIFTATLYVIALASIVRNSLSHDAKAGLATLAPNSATSSLLHRLIGTDVIFFAIFYGLTLHPESDLFLFNILPLATSLLYLEATQTLLAAGLIMIGLLLSLVFMFVFTNGVLVVRTRIYTVPILITHVLALRCFAFCIITLVMTSIRGIIMSHRFETEISERKAMDHQTWRFNAITSAGAALTFEKDNQKRFIYVSDAFADFLGQPREKILGKNDYDFFEPAIAAKYQKDDDWILSEQKTRLDPYEEDNRLLSSHSIRRVFVTKVAVRDQLGRTVGVLGTVFDLTQQYARQKSMFKWFVHDFPTPLDSIKQRYVEELRDILECFHSQLGQEAFDISLLKQGKAALAHILANVDFLSACGRGFGFLSGGESDTWAEGVGAHHFMMHDPGNLICDVLSPRYDELSFIKNSPNLKLASDFQKTTAILYMLVTNAIKAVKLVEQQRTPRIVISVDIEDNAVVWRVSDNGLGFPKGPDVPDDFQKRIFEEGFTFFKNQGSQREGAGFGLYIARAFANLAQGDVRIAPVPSLGAGTTFEVVIRKFQLL